MNTEKLTSWRVRIEQMGLTNLVDAALGVMEPFSPFLGQALWVMQPTLGLFVSRERVGDWANLLENPHGIQWLREQLIDEEHGD